jgi:hypothetical protein
MGVPYNPLDKVNLDRSVAEALLLRTVAPLQQTMNLAGAGVYAIYYTGDFEPYRPVAEKNRNGAFEQPIYAGKAAPKGARKGGLSFDASKGNALFAEKLASGGLTAEAVAARLKEYFAGQAIPLIPTEEAADIGIVENDE